MDELENLHRVGLKATLRRMRVLEVVRSSPQRHVAADDVYRRLVEIGFATVYRVVAQLEQAGVLARNTSEAGRFVFEFNEGRHHDHLLWVRCGRVDEFRDEANERRQVAVARERGFELQKHPLTPYRVCDECRVGGAKG